MKKFRNRQLMRLFLFSAMGILLHVAVGSVNGQPSSDLSSDWPSVGNDRGNARFSILDQINRGNVNQLEVVWKYRTGEPDKTIECTPVVIDGIMYLTTNHSRVVALDAESGKSIWEFDPLEFEPSKYPLASGGVNRGVAYWSDQAVNGQRRVIHGFADGRLFSIDARTGIPDPKFGNNGVKDLRADLQGDYSEMPYGPTSAPAIFENLIVVGFSCGEGPGPEAPGDIRAFDVRTGEQVWRFHTVPREGEMGNETWAGDSWQNRGGANAWGGICVDTQNERIFCGLGSASFDFFGGDRHGDNLFANCTIALEARTGKRIWHYQTTHHDIWDHDLPVYPNLVTVQRNGQDVEAVVQVTKQGYVFVFDRLTGAPLFEIEEKKVPPSSVPGESAATTQPVPVIPAPFSRTVFRAEDVTDVSAEQTQYVLGELEGLDYGQAFLPPSLNGTVIMPGFHGGANWSGACFDPRTDVLFVNSNNVPNVLQLAPAPAGSSFPFVHRGYNRFLDQLGYPAIKPPWGVLSAIDLNSGEYRWQVPLGEYPELTAKGIPQTGTETFGGAIATAGSLVFIGGTKDERFHAFDSATGNVLWEYQLPAGGYATPCTYAVNGRQFVTIAAGGAGKLGTQPGDYFVTFALPVND